MRTKNKLLTQNVNKRKQTQINVNKRKQNKKFEECNKK